MSQRRAPLPDDLGPYFSRQEAIAAGVTARRLDSAALSRPYRGVYLSDAPHEATDWEEEMVRHARWYEKRMSPSEFFSHTTAAVLHGIPIPRVDDRLHVSVMHPERAPRSRGVAGHALRPYLVTLVERDGLRMTSPASTWVTLGPLLRHEDLVAAGDAIILRRRRPGRPDVVAREALARLDDLRDAIGPAPRPGGKALRRALPELRTDSWSRPESWCRLQITACGLPEPLLNHDVRDATGRLVKCVDLAYPDLRIAVEYQGPHHREIDGYTDDIEKYAALVALGWEIIQVTWKHVFVAQDVGLRVRAAMRRRGVAA